MNLNAYDSMNPVFKTWIDSDTKKLYSNVIPYHKYYTFLKRYNGKNYDYYIAFSNTDTTDRVWYTTYITKSKSIKVDLRPIWDDSKFNQITDKQEVSVDVDAKFDDGIVYQIDI